jgi:raffinose/stachyose/melibiose transport system substrate-binding protein
MRRQKPSILHALLTAAALGVAALATTTPASAADAPRTVVTLWSWSPVQTTTAAMVAAIEQAHPDIEVRATIQPHTPYFTALKAAAASGTLPDIIGLPPGAFTQEYRAQLTDLGPVATQLWGTGWEKNFAPALLNQARLGNPKGDQAFYMLPQEAEVLNIWFNREAFAKAKIADPPATMDELVADARKLRAAGFIPFYQGGGTELFDAWVYMQIAAQTDLTSLLAAENGAAVWTKPGMVAAAAAWQRLFTDKIVQDGALSALQYPTGANLFAAGRVGMISLGSWWLQQTALSDNPNLKTMAGYGKFFFPAVTAGGKVSPPLGGIDIGWGITKTAASSPQVASASRTVLKELISGVGEQVALDQLNDLPAFRGLKPSQALDPHLQEIYSSYIAELETAHPHAIGNPVVFDALTSNLQAIAAGQKTPQAAMEEVQKVATAQAASGQ